MFPWITHSLLDCPSLGTKTPNRADQRVLGMGIRAALTASTLPGARVVATGGGYHVWLLVHDRHCILEERASRDNFRKLPAKLAREEPPWHLLPRITPEWPVTPPLRLPTPSPPAPPARQLPCLQFTGKVAEKGSFVRFCLWVEL